VRKRLKCPACPKSRSARLFDVERITGGVAEILCKKCGKVIEFRFNSDGTITTIIHP